MKYLLAVIFLVSCLIGYSQDTMRHAAASGSGNQGQVSYQRNFEADKLGNRKLIYKASVTDSCEEKGRVIVTVLVDKNGIVVKASVGRGTTASSACLQEQAKNAAMNSRFAPDENNQQLQTGRLSFNFKGNKN
jgi:TonB family protein